MACQVAIILPIYCLSGGQLGGKPPSMSHGVPDRWMNYSPMGEIIQGTRFICLKVPLKPSLLHSMSDESKFSCEDVIKMAEKTGRKLGLVIDLTFTKRYYNPFCFEKENIAYKKIFMPGRVIPEKSVMHDFYEAIENFEEDNQTNDNLIAVHCTHGLNRTGYMVCKYMIEKKGINADIAINMFEKARGHKMEREIYLADLKGEAPSSVDQNADINSQAHPPSGRYKRHGLSRKSEHDTRNTNQRDWRPSDRSYWDDWPYLFESPHYHQDYCHSAERSYWENNSHYRQSPPYRMYDNGRRAHDHDHMNSSSCDWRYNGYERNGYGHTQIPEHNWRSCPTVQVPNHYYNRWPKPWGSRSTQSHGSEENWSMKPPPPWRKDFGRP